MTLTFPLSQIPTKVVVSWNREFEAQTRKLGIVILAPCKLEIPRFPIPIPAPSALLQTRNSQIPNSNSSLQGALGGGRIGIGNLGILSFQGALGGGLGGGIGIGNPGNFERGAQRLGGGVNLARPSPPL